MWRVTWTNPDNTTGWRDITDASTAYREALWRRNAGDENVTVEEINP